MILLQEAIGAAMFAISCFSLMMLIGVPLLSSILFSRFKKQQESLNGTKASVVSVILMLLMAVFISAIIMLILSFIVISLLSTMAGSLD